MAKTPIFGPFSVSRSTNASDNQIVNLYPEIVETKQGKSVGALYGCPGLDLVATVGGGPIRGLHPTINQNGLARLFVVSGTGLYQLDSSFSATNIGTVAASGQVTMIDNQFQLGIFVGTNGYVWPFVGGFAPIALPFTPTGGTITAAQQDGFGLINQPNTSFLFQSDLLDLATWNALNFGDASGDPDDIMVLGQIHREIWVVKQNNTEIWYNAGTPGFVFARLDGAYMEAGCAAVGSFCQVGESLIWLAQDLAGAKYFVTTQGHALPRISTHALESEIAKYATVADAVAYSYLQEGHLFYVVTFPTADMTWCYDVTASTLTGTPMWHRRASFSGGQLHRHIGQNACYFGGKNIVGDYQTGNLYAFNLNTLTDNGAQRKWLRTWRALPEPIEHPVSFHKLRIDMQTGIAIDPNTNPQLVLRWSDDGGHVWSSEKFEAAGKAGQTAHRVMYRRLGGTRRNSGLDRIFEISSTDPFPVAIVGADLDAA
jgi:hypothetical protein